MSPTLEDGGVALLKNLEEEDSLNLNDIIVFDIKGYDREVNRGTYIKRIVGKPGDTISYSKYGLLTNNGEVIYVEDIESGIPILNKEEIELGEDEYYVIGDNYSNSMDSRSFGVIKEEEIVGKLLIK